MSCLQALFPENREKGFFCQGERKERAAEEICAFLLTNGNKF